MQAAFALLVVLPPPAAGALGLAGLDGARTGFAADRGIAAPVHRVHRNRIVGDIGLDALDVPVGQRIDLDQAAFGVELRERRVGTVAGLAAAKAGDPEGCPFECARKRLQLAHAATGVARLDALVEAVEAVLRGIGVDIVLAGMITRDGDAVLVLGLVDEVDGLLEEAAGLQRRDVDAEALGADGRRDHLVLDAEAGGEDGTPAKPGHQRKASGKVEFGEFVIEGLRGPVSGESSHSIPCLCEKLPDYRSLARPETAKRISEMSAREQISLHLAPRAEILPPFPAVKKLDSKNQI
ncbi:exported protein of unknown function [Shinella sp. WSC3-e]|nr:exported hypothetical protein [Rhizobiaceae bacterium]CAK7255183.1 exported protein of unknown function [Shinella sp. WSC3-e]